MFQRDYILRMIEQMTSVVGRYMMLLREQRNEQEEIAELEEFYGRMLLPPSKLLVNMPDEELLSLVSLNGIPDLEKTAALALLLKEEGCIYEDLGRFEESHVRFVKSLFLFLTSCKLGADVPGVDCREQIDGLRELLRTYPIPDESLLGLVFYYEGEGRYAHAEDALFELLEATPTEARMAEGRSFFDRLDELSDEALIAGGLSRTELQDGRKDMEFLRKENKNFRRKIDSSPLE